MEENKKSFVNNEMAIKETPRLVALLKEMKDGLDAVRSKVQALTIKVKENSFPTVDGISYLEAKHLLLLSYCESIVYYLLRKAKGLSIEGHPVVQSLVEIRLFLEKIRPIDKKLEYQTQKLLRGIGGATEKADHNEKETDSAQNADDPLKYRPNPDLLISKINHSSQDGGDVYRPPKFAPTTMEEEKTLKQEKLARRRMKETLRQAEQSDFVRKMMDDFEGKPEEVRESFGAESGELKRYRAKMEERARQEEDLFIRAPLTKMEKKREKHLKKSRNGLRGLTDDFFDEIRTLPLEDDGNDHKTSFATGGSSGGKRHSKRKRNH